MAKKTVSKLETYKQEQKKAYISKDYKKAQEIQLLIDEIEYGYNTNNEQPRNSKLS